MDCLCSRLWSVPYQNQIVRRIVFLVSINVMKLKAISDMFGKPRCGAFRMGI